MVIYVKFNNEDKPVEFTTALEAKQHLTDNAGSLAKGESEESTNSVFVAVVSEAAPDTDELDYSEFDNIEGAKEFIDSEVAKPADEADDSEDSSEDEDKEDSSEEKSDDADDDSSEEGEKSEGQAA